jgi:universal stress protein E
MANKKILVVVDPTAAEHPCVDRAASLAENVSAELELFICDYDPNLDAGRTSAVYMDQPAREDLLGILRDKLERLAGTLRGRGLKVDVDVAWDHPLVDGIVRKVVASAPWMVVKDTHHHNVLKRTILSNTDWGLIRECPAPLFLVKPGPIAQQPKVFAAVDPLHEHDKPAELDNRILAVARTLAESANGELHAVHTFSIPVPIGGPEAVPSADLIQAVEEEHKQAMAEFLKGKGLHEGFAHVLEGAPQDRLPEVVEHEGVAVLVMGAVSRRGLSRIFVGSTAERVLDRIGCDLVIVKPEGFKTSVG